MYPYWLPTQTRQKPFTGTQRTGIFITVVSWNFHPTTNSGWIVPIRSRETNVVDCITGSDRRTLSVHLQLTLTCGGPPDTLLCNSPNIFPSPGYGIFLNSYRGSNGLFSAASPFPSVERVKDTLTKGVT